MVFHLLQVDRPRPCTARGAEERRVTAGVGHNLGKHHVDNLPTFVNIFQHHHVDNLTTGQGKLDKAYPRPMDAVVLQSQMNVVLLHQCGSNR